MKEFVSKYSFGKDSGIWYVLLDSRHYGWQNLELQCIKLIAKNWKDATEVERHFEDYPSVWNEIGTETQLKILSLCTEELNKKQQELNAQEKQKPKSKQQLDSRCSVM